MSKLAALSVHPSTPAPQLRIEAGLRALSGDLIAVRYEVTGAIHSVVIPPAPGRPPRRKDGLWQATCFEAFAEMAAKPAYREFNFSASGDWAAYDFTAYREGMRNAVVKRELIVVVLPVNEMLVVEEIIADTDLSSATKLNLTAVIEALDGTKSYWALAHPAEGPPDFHHPDCFALTLPPPGEP